MKELDEMYNSTHYVPFKIEIIDYDKPIQFGNTVIRKMTGDEIFEFLGIKEAVIDENGRPGDIILRNVDSSTHESVPHELFGALYLIEFQNNKEFHSNNSILLSAFRIYRTGDVFAPWAYTKGRLSISYSHPEFTNYQVIYRIKEKEINDVYSIYKRLTESTSEKTKLIIERFNNAIASTTSLQNCFVELTSILESILVNESFELRFRFSLYGAFILSQIGESKFSVKELQKIYDIRSQLIHTGKSTKYTEGELDSLREISIKLIKWYIFNDDKKNYVKELVYEKLGIK